jgi:hypothetical protein
MAGKEKKVVMLFGQRNRWRVSSICMIMSSLSGFSRVIALYYLALDISDIFYTHRSLLHLFIFESTFYNDESCH